MFKPSKIDMGTQSIESLAESIKVINFEGIVFEKKIMTMCVFSCNFFIVALKKTKQLKSK